MPSRSELQINELWDENIILTDASDPDVVAVLGDVLCVLPAPGRHVNSLEPAHACSKKIRL